FVEQALGLFPFAGKQCRLWCEVNRIFVRWILRAPAFDLFLRKTKLTAPNVDLNDAVADGFARIEGSATFIHGAGGIEQTDVRENCSEAIVCMRQIALQRERSLQLPNRFHVLKVLGRSPEQKRIGYMPFWKIRV